MVINSGNMRKIGLSFEETLGYVDSNLDNSSLEIVDESFNFYDYKKLKEECVFCSRKITCQDYRNLQNINDTPDDKVSNTFYKVKIDFGDDMHFSIVPICSEYKNFQLDLFKDQYGRRDVITDVLLKKVVDFDNESVKLFDERIVLDKIVNE